MSDLRRVRFTLAAMTLAAGLVWLAAPAPGQDPKQPPAPGQTPPGKGEEEEEPGKPIAPPKKVEVEEDPPGTTAPVTPPGGEEETQPAKDGPQGVYIAKLDDVARAAAAAPHPAVKDYLARHAVAFDRLGLTTAVSKTYRVTPVPLLWGKAKFPDPFGAAQLDQDNVAGEVKQVKTGQVRQLDPFELVAVEATAEFLKPEATPKPAPAADKLAAAERLLTAVLFFHDSARDQNRRRGKHWDPVKATVYDKLTEVRVARVRQSAADKDWAKLKELSGRLVGLYKDNPKVLEPVYAARLAEAEVLVQSGAVTDLQRGRELLNEYDARFPGTGNEAAKRVRAELAKLAKKFLNDADRATDKAQARRLLDTVAAIDPDNSSLIQKQREMKTGYPTLIVATRRLPELMSPALARFDSEHQAVELMFEGLLEAIPDEQLGVRFRPALAAERPGVGPGVRDVQLVRSADWAGPDRGVFDASDVAGTLRMMRQRPAGWAAEPAGWLAEPGFDAGDPGRIRMRFRVGHPHPQQLLTFKLHPDGWLRARNKEIDDVEFARHPFGTGPFKLAPTFRPANPGEPPRDVVFVANPAYARRPGRMAQPAIREVVFTDAGQFPDLPTEFRAGRVHLTTDVPTADLPRYAADNGLDGRVRVATAMANRRLHVLAVNHRRPGFHNPDVRVGLSLAIDRERVLNEVYRAGRNDVHRALTGPFPAGSWATPPVAGLAPSLYNRDAAQARFKQYLAAPNAAPTLGIVYPADDPQARAACERIKGMVESATANDERKLSVTLEPLPPRELLRRVGVEHRYDLAFLTFDYRDDWYPFGLGSLLDPDAAGPGGRNYLGYLAPGSGRAPADEQLARLLTEARLHRDTEGALNGLAHKAHKLFNDAVPFVPLWQIDRHMVIATAVKVYLDGQVEEANPRVLNPTTLFSSVGKWRVE